MRIETSRFVSRDAADAYYYAARGITPAEVDRKIAEFEIAIGAPPVQSHQRVVVVDSGARYAIDSCDLHRWELVDCRDLVIRPRRIS